MTVQKLETVSTFHCVSHPRSNGALGAAGLDAQAAAATEAHEGEQEHACRQFALVLAEKCKNVITVRVRGVSAVTPIGRRGGNGAPALSHVTLAISSEEECVTLAAPLDVLVLILLFVVAIIRVVLLLPHHRSWFPSQRKLPTHQ